MGIFDKFKKNEKNNQWEKAEVNVANPHFYSDKIRNVFGAFELT